MADSPKEDELREDPLAADMADLSEGPKILDAMVWTSKLEPQAELELCPLSPFPGISGSSSKEGMHTLTDCPSPQLIENASMAWAFGSSIQQTYLFT